MCFVPPLRESVHATALCLSASQWGLMWCDPLAIDTRINVKLYIRDGNSSVNGIWHLFKSHFSSLSLCCHKLGAIQKNCDPGRKTRRGQWQNGVSRKWVRVSEICFNVHFHQIHLIWTVIVKGGCQTSLLCSLFWLRSRNYILYV